MEDFKKPELMYDLGMLKTNVGSTPRHMGVFCCSCGKWFKANVGHVKFGRVKSCGCYKKRVSSAMLLTHGKSKSVIYAKWSNMISRCTNPNNKDYFRYGGRGISVCDEWRNSFANFNEWAIQNGYDDALEPDRINNDGNYEPNNVRWASHQINGLNRRQFANKTGFKGVKESHNRFVSSVVFNGNQIYVGTYPTALDAALAYNQYIIENKLPNKLGIIP